MRTYEAGTLASAGSFQCESCGFAVALHESEEIPACPSCDGDSFRRSAMFGVGGSSTAPQVEDSTPDWLEEARDALVSGGSYLAFETDDRVQVVQLQNGWTRIGRSLSAHVRLDDPTVSRRHALLYRDDEGAKILDDRSLNGVFCNGEAVDLSELNDGDTIAVGRFTLHYIELSGDRSGMSAAGATA